MRVSAFNKPIRANGKTLWSCRTPLQSAAGEVDAFKNALKASTPLKITNVKYETITSFSGEFVVSDIPLTNGKTDKITVTVDGTNNKAHIILKSKTFGTFEDDLTAGSADFSKIAKKTIQSINDILSANANA